MDAGDVAKLLETEWPSIRQQLGESWASFHRAYRSVIATLPQEPTRRDLERVADEICQLMSRHPYTLGLLRGWHGVCTERLLPSPAEALPEGQQVRQICNRFKVLAEQAGPDEAPRENREQWKRDE